VPPVDDQLFALVTDENPEVRQRAGEGLSPLEWSETLSTLVTVLEDERLSHAWPKCYELLPPIVDGAVSFDYFVGYLANSPNDAVFGRLAAILGLAAGTRRPRFANGHAEPGDLVLPEPALPVNDRGEAAAAVALLGSPLAWVRERAVRFLAQHGRHVMDMLRAVRAARTPARRGALSAIAEIDWTALAPAERALVQRLVRVKQRTEVPKPLVPQGEWYALPTTDQAAVLAAFDLRDPVPVTMRMGFAPWHLDGWQALPWYTGYGSTAVYEQVLVTPALDGWTLVFANGSTLTGDEEVRDEKVPFAATHRRCAELSRRFGAAHWYLESANGGCWDESGWCVAENGEIVRYCYHDHYVEGGARIGPGPTSAEDLRAWVAEHDPGTGVPPVRPEPGPSAGELFQAWLDANVKPDPELVAYNAEHDEDEDDEPLDTHEHQEEETSDWEFGALDVAWRLSVSPEAIGPHTTVEGTAVLAVPAGTPDSWRHGALPI